VGKTNILLVCANPRGTDPLRTAEEDRTLRESLRLSPNREDFDVQTLNAATVDDLRRALLWKPFDVVHFSGHGTQGGLIFEDAQGKLMVPHSAALAELLHRRGVRVALLNACYSLSVGTISAIGLDYTVASTGPISDPGAIEFARGFYDALGAGYDVPDAFAEGMSAAKLKNMSVDAVLLRKGEALCAPDPAPMVSPIGRSSSGPTPRTLLGVAIDASGSMQGSMQNRTGPSSTRFEEVTSSLAEIGKQLRDELKVRSPELGDTFHAFLYAFGLRVGSGVADIASLWAAAQRLDLEREIAIRRRMYEADARQKAAQYSGLASLARNFGYGNLVDSVVSATAESIRERIIGEVASVVLHEAERLDTSTLTAEKLAELFDDGPASRDTRLMDHLLFGSTPMVAVAEQIYERFHRLGTAGFSHRTLLLISDGEPTDGDPRPVLEKIRKSGINVVACFVTSEDVADPRTLHGAPSSNWATGARLMWDAASPIDEAGPAARLLLSHGWSIEKNAKLFVQINHSDVLKEFARIAATQFAQDAINFLPRGQ
jgi:hypothetical protein